MAFTWTIRRDNHGPTEPLHVSLAAGTLTLSFGGHTNLSLDGEGRLVGAWYDGITYRRALDNRVLAKWSEPAKITHRQRRLLSSSEAEQLISRAYADALTVQDGLGNGSVEPTGTDIRDVQLVEQWLSVACEWHAGKLGADAEHFHKVYKPVSILPPDQYLSAVLQATEGCSYNECSFCTFYRDRAFRIKRLPEFERHIHDVVNYLGRGLYMRRSLFLADANAIVIAQSRLVPLLEAVNKAFQFNGGARAQSAAITLNPARWTPSGINAFVSAPDALRKSAAELRELAQLHVQRLYVGLETGHDPLRSFLRKPGRASDALHAVSTIKEGGLQVGLIIMTGIGGEHYRQPHFRDTLDVVERMPLGAGDIVYLSPFVASPDSPYLDDMQRAGYSSLVESEALVEEARFRTAFQSMLRSKGARLSRYDIREFVY